jgi:long-chain acyl-CoA synthetase
LRRFEPLTLQRLLVNSAHAFAAHPALSMVNGTPVTYATVFSRARGVAAHLAGRGIGKGDRVALLSENRPEWGICYLGVASMGAVVVPLMTDFPAPQIRSLMAHAGCALLIVSARMRERLGADGAAPDGPAVIDIEELAARSDEGYVFPPVAEEDLAAIIYTSGTTGQSKGVQLSHRNIVFDAWATRPIIRITTHDRVLSILPLAHTYECTIGFLTPFMQGAHIAYMDKPPSATALLPAMQKIRPTIICSVPLVMEKVYRSKVLPELEKIALYRVPLLRRLIVLLAGRKLMKTFGGSVRFFGIGGAGVSPDVERFLSEARFPYAIGYGLTETSPLIAGSTPLRTRMRSTGPVLRGVQVRIADMKPGTRTGEIQVRGPNVMSGYYKDPARTAEAFTEDGWFRTGDLGEIDGRAHLYIRGRLKTMILSASGENIYPEEIEAVINQSPYVDESLVYGDGSGVAALVLLKPDALAAFSSAVQKEVAIAQHTITHLLDRIRDEVNAKVSGFSRVQRVVLQPIPFEKTPSQKIKRFLYPKGAQT